MKRDEIKNALIHSDDATGEAFAKWREDNNVGRMGEMTKAQWEAAYAEIVQGDAPAPVPTPQPAPAKPAKVPASPALSDRLDGLALAMGDAAVKPLRDAVKAMNDQIDTLTHERDAAKVAAAQAASVPVMPTKPGQHVTQYVKAADLGELIGARTAYGRETLLNVCDSPDAPSVDPLYVYPKVFADICRAVALGLNVALFGDRGTGKSSLVRQFAAITKRPHFEISFHGEISAEELIGGRGFDDSGTRFDPGILLEAIQTPYAVVEFSEINVARPELVMQLNAILERKTRSLLAGGKRWDVHPTVSFFATSNDNGSGEGAARFAGVRPMNDATRSRFAWVELELPSKSGLTSMLAKAANLPKAAAEMLAEFEVNAQAHVKAGDCEATPGMRAMVAWGELVMAGVPSRIAFGMGAEHVGTSDDAAVWRQEATSNFDHKRFEAICAGDLVTDRDANGQPVDAEEGPTRSGFGEL